MRAPAPDGGRAECRIHSTFVSGIEEHTEALCWLGSCVARRAKCSEAIGLSLDLQPWHSRSLPLRIDQQDISVDKPQEASTNRNGGGVGWSAFFLTGLGVQPT